MKNQNNKETLPKIKIHTSKPGDFVTKLSVKNHNKWGRDSRSQQKKENMYMIK